MQFTVSRETHDKLRRVQDLLRHAIPNGDPAAIFDRALTVLLSDLERTKLAAAARPRSARHAASGSRHVPAAVRRDVWKRDDGRCAFVGAHGRCTERGFLEFHHRVPYAAGGTTVVENIVLRCRAHNVYEAEQYFGDRLPLLAREARGPAYCARLGPDRVRSRLPFYHGARHNTFAVAANAARDRRRATAARKLDVAAALVGESTARWPERRPQIQM